MLSLDDITPKELRALADWSENQHDFKPLIEAGIRPVVEQSGDPTKPDRFIGWERYEGGECYALAHR